MVIRRKTHTRWIWTAAALGVVATFFLAHWLTQTKTPVRTAVVVRSELQSTTPTNGRVEPQVNFEVHAPFPGLVKSIYVHEGEHVTEGKLLLSLDDTDAKARVVASLAAMRGAQAVYDDTLKGGTQEERISFDGEMSKAQMDLDQAQHDVDALKKLQLTGAASASEVAAAQQRLAADQSSLQVIQARKTRRYDAGDVDRAKTAFQQTQAAYSAAVKAVNDANPRAPFAGIVYSLPVTPTEYVQQGDRLLSMADLHKIQVHAYFDEPEIGKLEVGQPLTIEWDARPRQIWHGHIARVPSTIVVYNQTRNVGDVLVAVDDADETLLPNTNVRVTVITANKANALSIPRDALHSEQGKSYVYMLRNGELHRTIVVHGEVNVSQVEILSGLKEGDVVVLGTTNGQPLGDRMPAVAVQ
jgi:HlyD family secretion protein